MSDEFPLPLYARLRDQLRASILEGRLQPHDKLPSESELTAAHGVSRITVRQALGDLQKEGLIRRLQGKGAFVSHPHTSQSLNRLQGLGEALSGQGRSVHSKRLSMKRVKAPAALAAQLRLEDGAAAWQLMTLRYVEREPLSVNCSWFALPLGERIARLDLSGRDLIEVLEQDLGHKVAQAELDISAVAMPRREARMLKVAAGQPALRVHRVLCSALQAPLQVETAVYRADAFSYRLSVTR
jgi:GntR family transcriptional regulator